MAVIGRDGKEVIVNYTCPVNGESGKAHAFWTLPDGRLMFLCGVCQHWLEAETNQTHNHSVSIDNVDNVESE